jgi:tRNA threonylcarbamoyladenosine biosynthesis protein TsaE
LTKSAQKCEEVPMVCMKKAVLTQSPQQTMELAYKIGRRCFPGCTIALYGDLGSGKTVFAKGLAGALGIGDVTSPTYTIMNAYQGKLPFYHFDAYRIDDEEELCAFGGDEFLYSDGVCVIEWPERIEGLLPKERLDIHIQYVDEQTRRFTWMMCAESHQRLLEELET